MKRLTTFLIDDDDDDREIFDIAIEKTDWDIVHHSAKNGLEAISMLETDEDFLPDIIFLDLNMPKMNGRQCLSEIKKITRLQHIPVYIYSTSSEPLDKSDLIQEGAASFITKPSYIQELTQSLSTIFSHIKEKNNN